MPKTKTTTEMLRDAKNTIRRRGEKIRKLEARLLELDAQLVHAKEGATQVEGLQHEIATLKEELRGAVEEGNRLRDDHEAKVNNLELIQSVRDLDVSGLKQRIGRLKSALGTAWRHNDSLRGQLAGSQLMPDGRTAREHAREAILAGGGE